MESAPGLSIMKCLLGRALSPSVYFLLGIVQLLQYCCSADAGSKLIFAAVIVLIVSHISDVALLGWEWRGGGYFFTRVSAY